MTLDQYHSECGFDGLSETGKACHLAYFYLKRHEVETFDVHMAAEWLIEAGGASPNIARLYVNLRKSSLTAKAGTGFRLIGGFVRDLDKRFPHLSEKSQEVIEDGTILPEPDYQQTRGYIQDLAKQINASYEHNVFDGCAVLMRRLMEVLLILSYRHNQIDAAITDGNGNYLVLERIIDDAVANATLKLSRNTKGCLDKFRVLGNFSAHSIEYTCRRQYIQPLIPNYRALVVELLHKAGIRK